MTTYRVFCRYEPSLVRLGGQEHGSTRRLQKLGAWRVTQTRTVPPGRYCPVIAAIDEVGVLSPTRPRRGTLCDPYKLLKSWIKCNGR